MDTHSSYSKGTRALKALWDGENGDKLRAIFDDTFEFHNLNDWNEMTDLKDLRRRMAELRAAHPGARLRVENMIGSGSHFAFDWTLQEPGPKGAREQYETSTQIIRHGQCMVRVSGDCVAELWELTGALTG